MLSTGRRFRTHRANGIGRLIKTIESEGRAYRKEEQDEDRGKKGDAILQPGAYDGGKNPSDRIGTLDGFVKLTLNFGAAPGRQLYWVLQL